jgi:hypothetical protein
MKRALNLFAQIAFAIAILLAPSRARAFSHLVVPNESLAQIAQRVYGSTQYESVLAGANALDTQGGSAIVPGMHIEIPAPGHHRVALHETWADLALAWLGNASRADVLARANGGLAWVPPNEGEEIVIPCVVTHIAGPTDDGPTLARRYYGDTMRAWELDAYNTRHGIPIHRGDVVLIPLVDLHLTDAGKAEAKHAAEIELGEAAGGTHDTQHRADAELPGLLADVRGGRYVEAVARGNRLLGAGALTRPQLALVHRALLEAYVALDTGNAGPPGNAIGACTAWRAAAAGDPKIDTHLDPKFVSPKIRAACATATLNAAGGE